MSIFKVNSEKEYCAKCFEVHILKFEILQTTWKKKPHTPKCYAISIDENWKLRVWYSLFHFFMWFARFQILVFEPKSIWRKLLVLSWLYKLETTKQALKRFHKQIKKKIFKSRFGSVSWKLRSWNIYQTASFLGSLLYYILGIQYDKTKRINQIT